ncbi:MFS transporter [Aquibacillus sediminis]|uniref:MFS transporter n=1 Tax=Aquibacillus sediminis TaxID=2574734 RepID=UPI0011086A55|nr:MFS transporter [Aquibacillus sediminis]
MRRIKILIIVLTSVFMFSITGSRPLIPMYAEDLGAPNYLIGLIVALFSFLPLFLSVKLGKIVDESGSKKFLGISLLVGGISLIFPFLFDNLVGVILSQIFAGLAHIVYVVAMQSFAGGFAEKEWREYFINLFSISVALGSFLGPLVGGIIAEVYGFSIALLGGGVLLISMIPFVKWVEDHDEKTQTKEEKRKEKDFKLVGLFKIKSLQYAFLVSALILLAKDTYIAFFPLLARDYGINESMIGLIVSLNAAAGILIRLMLPFLISHMNRRTIINSSILLSGVIFLLHPFISSTFLLIVLSFILGIGLGIGQPLSIATTVESLPSNKIGEGLGLRLTINRLTQLVTPVSLGGIASFVGIGGVFYFTGFIVVGGILVYFKKVGDSSRTSI